MTTPFPKVNSQQAAENSILDYYYRQVYLGNSFVLNSGNLAISDTTVHNTFLIVNRSTNTKSLFFYLYRAGGTGPFYVQTFINPTVTGAGSAATPVNLRPAYSTVSSATCTTSPTTSATGTSLGVSVINGAQSESRKMWIQDPGTTSLITIQSVSASGGSPIAAFLELIWYEI